MTKARDLSLGGGASSSALATTNATLATATSKLAGIETGATADQTKADIDSLGINRGRNNLIINGDMKVAQRATSVTGLGANGGTYSTVDRYRFDFGSTAGRLTATQTAITDLAGFSKCTKLDCTTADTSIAAGEYFQFVQRLEGQDIQRLAYGTSSAKTTTVSFYVKGTAKTYMCELHDAENTRLVQQQFNVTTSWTRVSLTFAGNTSGTIADSAALGLYLNFWLHAGSTYTSGTYNANTWKSQVNADRAVGIGSFFSSTSNELFITGIQFETGSVATDFEHRSFGEELALCQRYFYNPLHNLNGARGSFNIDYLVSSGNNGWITWTIPFPVSMRASSTFSHSLTPAKFLGSAAPADGQDKFAFYIQNQGYAGLVGNGSIANLGGGGQYHGIVGTYYCSPSSTSASHIFIGNGCTFQFDAEL